MAGGEERGVGIVCVTCVQSAMVVAYFKLYQISECPFVKAAQFQLCLCEREREGWGGVEI